MPELHAKVAMELSSLGSFCSVCQGVCHDDKFKTVLSMVRRLVETGVQKARNSSPAHILLC